MSNKKAVVDLTKALGKNLSEEGSDLPILNPLGEEIGITLRVKSIKSEDGRAMIRKQTEKSTKKQVRWKKETAAEVEKSNAEFLRTVVVGGDIFAVAGKEISPSSLSFEDALLITKEYSFIMTQVIEFASSDANFYGELVGN